MINIMLEERFLKLAQSILVRMNQLEVHLNYVMMELERGVDPNEPRMQPSAPETSAQISDLNGLLSPFGTVCYTDDHEWILVMPDRRTTIEQSGVGVFADDR